MKKSSGGKGQARYAAQGHPLAYWDDHPSSRTCLPGVRIFFTRNMPCNTCKAWSEDMWAAFENAEIRSAHKREKRRLLRAAKEAAASGSRPPSPESLSAVVHMPPPSDPPRRVLKSSSTSRRNASMGADADWWHVGRHRFYKPQWQPRLATETRFSDDRSANYWANGKVFYREV